MLTRERMSGVPFKSDAVKFTHADGWGRCLAAAGTLATINTESREYVKEVGLADVAQSRLRSAGRAGEAARELIQLLS